MSGDRAAGRALSARSAAAAMRRPARGRPAAPPFPRTGRRSSCASRLFRRGGAEWSGRRRGSGRCLPCLRAAGCLSRPAACTARWVLRAATAAAAFRATGRSRPRGPAPPTADAGPCAPGTSRRPPGARCAWRRSTGGSVLPSGRGRRTGRLGTTVAPGCGDIPPAELETAYYRQNTSLAEAG
jgi:hypothetical protein